MLSTRSIVRPVDGLFGFHAVVLLSMSSSSVVVLDPNQGTRTIGLSAFETAWNEAEREAVTISARSSI